MREKQVPVDVVEMKGKSHCHCPVVEFTCVLSHVPLKLLCKFMAQVEWPRLGTLIHSEQHPALSYKTCMCLGCCPFQLQSLSFSSCQVK